MHQSIEWDDFLITRLNHFCAQFLNKGSHTQLGDTYGTFLAVLGSISRYKRDMHREYRPAFNNPYYKSWTILNKTIDIIRYARSVAEINILTEIRREYTDLRKDADTKDIMHSDGFTKEEISSIIELDEKIKNSTDPEKFTDASLRNFKDEGGYSNLIPKLRFYENRETKIKEFTEKYSILINDWYARVTIMERIRNEI